MSTIETLDAVVVVVLVATIPAVNLFPIAYGFWSPWWTTLAGRALMVKSISTLLLVDLAVMVRALELDPLTLAWLRVAIVVLIFAGTALMFFALLREYWPRFKRWTTCRARS